jgi:hypothetical protein
MYAGSFAYAVLSIGQQNRNVACWTFLIFLLVSVITSIGGAVYLAKTGSKTADNAIHGEKA